MDYGTLSGLAGLITLQSGMNLFSASASNRQSYKYTKKLQKRQQEWMERMSNTAHQREVEDLRLAGLNPILSASGNGAVVGSASSPAIHSQVPNVDILGSLSTIAQLKKMESEIDLDHAQTEKMKSSVSVDNAQTEKLNAETAEIKSDTAAKDTLVGGNVAITKPGGRGLGGFRIGDTFFGYNKPLSVRQYSALQALSKASQDYDIKDEVLQLRKQGVNISERELQLKAEKVIEEINEIRSRTDLNRAEEEKLIHDIINNYAKTVTDAVGVGNFIKNGAKKGYKRR